MIDMTSEAVAHGTCPECGSLMLPVLDLLPCGHDGPALVSPLTDVGTVYSWTRVWVGEQPRLMAMVDFLDGALRVTAPLVGTTSVAIGDRVRLEVGDDTPYRHRAMP